MRRRHTPAELSYLARARALYRAILGGRDPGRSGRSRKKHPLDCGNPGCPWCHSDKRPGRTPTAQEAAAEARLAEGAAELEGREPDVRLEHPGY